MRREELLLRPFVPRLTIDWLRTQPDSTHREVEGSLAFVDISGFTRLTERLARRGRVGAEELSDILNTTFSALLRVAYDDGAGLVKWGGDAVLLLFEGPDHAPRAAQAAFRMRAVLQEIGRLQTSSGPVTLRMSVGIHSGLFHFFLVGDPEHHRELLISGPAASITAHMEATADAGQIALSEQAALLVDKSCLGAQKGSARLLRRNPGVKAAEAPPPMDTGGLDLTRVLPGSIRQQVLADTRETEHRTIAVGFVQFSGTDALLETSGPAALATALDECIRNVQSALARYDVTFFETDINADGGKVMLTAGAPRSVEHAEERMLLAGRQILRNAGALPLRMGINRGNVFSGDFGPPFRRTYSVKGDAINLAARVMGKARPGQLLATEAVVERTTAPVATVRLEPFTVKGKRLPVQAYEIALADVHTAPEPSRQHTLIGRDAELDVLRRAVAEATAGSGRVVQIVGEPGIGKSRLVEEVTATTEDLGLISVSCDAYEVTTPYFLLRALLRQAIGLPDALGREAGAAELAQCILTRVPGLVPWIPLLALVLDLPAEPTKETQSLDPQHAKSRLAQTVVDLMTALVAEPTLIVVDDVHLMDDASAEVFSRLADQVPHRPWALIVMRREHRTGFVPGAEIITIRPRPLDVESSRLLAERATQDLPLPPHTIEALLARAGGNPLFLRGLAHAAQAHEDVDNLPDSVDGLVNSQIDQLAPSERAILRAAAVLGVTFSQDDLLALLDDEKVDEQAVLGLSNFLAADGSGRHRFRHALLRDAAYQGLAYRRRRELHERAGELIETQSEDPEQFAELLSFHYSHSERHDRTWHFSRLAGDRARDKFANVEAIEFYGRAADVAGRHQAATDSERVQVLESLGDARFVVGLTADADAAFKAARRHARDDPLSDALLILKQARTAKVQGQFSQALSRLTRGLTRLDSTSAQQPELPATDAVGSARSLLASEYALCLTMQSRYPDAITWGHRAAELARQCGDNAALARAYVVLQDVHVWSGRQQEQPFGQLALEIYEERGDLIAASYCRNGLAVEAFFEGRWPDALAMYRHAREDSHRAGAASDAANCEFNVADVLLRQGHIAEAQNLLTHVRQVARGVDDPELEAFAMRELGRAAARSGQVEDGLNLCREARTAFTQLGAHHEKIDTDLAEAECLLVGGDALAALNIVDQALLDAESLGAATLVPTTHRVRGFALLADGRLDLAEAEFTNVLRLSQPPAPQHEVGYALAGIVETKRLLGTSDPLLDARAGQAMASFGIVALPAGGGGLRPSSATSP